MSQLADTARALVAVHKGILAADESSGTIEKRFKSIDVSSTEENRRAYRELLFSAPGVEEFISGVILYDETIRQKAKDGTPFPQLLAKRGIIPGIKVDKGTKAVPFSKLEKITGADGLREDQRVPRSRRRFAKWRAVIEIGDGIPSDTCIETNAHALARYAALCVEGGLVPIVEPEVLMDGSHPIARCYEATDRTLRAVFRCLNEQRVALEEILLKPNMVLSGKGCPQQASVREVAEQTLRCFRNTVPAALPGIVFLSGGQSDEAATAHLSEMNKLGGGPWELSFPTAARSRRRRSRPGAASWRTRPLDRRPSCTAPAATARHAPEATPKRWRRPARFSGLRADPLAPRRALHPTASNAQPVRQSAPASVR
jgi:fructose-bisphosphate aldolase class I